MVYFSNMRKVKITLLFPICHETDNMLPKLCVVSKGFTAMFTMYSYPQEITCVNFLVMLNVLGFGARSLFNQSCQILGPYWVFFLLQIGSVFSLKLGPSNPFLIS